MEETGGYSQFPNPLSSAPLIIQPVIPPSALAPSSALVECMRRAALAAATALAYASVLAARRGWTFAWLIALPLWCGGCARRLLGWRRWRMKWLGSPAGWSRPRAEGCIPSVTPALVANAINVGAGAQRRATLSHPFPRGVPSSARMSVSSVAGKTEIINDVSVTTKARVTRDSGANLSVTAMVGYGAAGILTLVVINMSVTEVSPNHGVVTAAAA